MTWNPTQLTTVQLGASRTIEETTLNNAAGAIGTTFSASVDHELLRYVILTGDASYQNLDYDGISREDDTLGVGAGGTYLMNRHLRFNMRYGYATRSSNIAGQDYDTHTIRVGLTTQY